MVSSMKMVFYFFMAFMSIQLLASDIVVVTLAAGKNYNKIVQAGISNKRSYCKKHGYDFIVGDSILDSSRPPQWSKILLIAKVMRENPQYKWIFWTDADALIMHPSTRLEEFIDNRYHFILTRDDNNYNTGHFFLKNCGWSQRFLDLVYSHTEYIHADWWEQRAVIKELETNAAIKSRTKIVPQRSFNSYLEGSPSSLYCKGDFILHFAGVHDRDLLSSLMRRYAEEAKKSGK